MTEFAAPFVLEYTYDRSLGPVLSRFFTGLRDGQLLGIRTADGRVLAPPSEYDPRTGASTEGFVDIGPAGVVTTWTWVGTPRPQDPLDRPFAWALIQLDGADTALLHVVDAPHDQLRTGLRVRARWRAERCGSILDIEAFEVAL
jgi:uncharacterized OB-fold protein